MADQLFPVPFQGDNVVLVNHDDQPFVAMKPVVENMGLSWDTQYRKLAEKFSSVIVKMTTTGGDGKQYEMVCLPLRKLPAWLYSISPNKVAPELREKIIAYQEECDEALWNYWTEGVAVNSRTSSLSTSELARVLRDHGRLLLELKNETNPAIRQSRYSGLALLCRKLNIPLPALDQVGREEKPEPVSSLVADFWEVAEFIGLETLNHSRQNNLIAINLRQFEQAAREAKVSIPDLRELNRFLRQSEVPRFVDCKVVSSGLLNRAVRCWVFERNA